MEHSSSSYAIPDDSQEWSGVILDDQQVSGHTVNLSYVCTLSVSVYVLAKIATG